MKISRGSHLKGTCDDCRHEEDLEDRYWSHGVAQIFITSLQVFSSPFFMYFHHHSSWIFITFLREFSSKFFMYFHLWFLHQLTSSGNTVFHYQEDPRILRSGRICVLLSRRACIMFSGRIWILLSRRTHILASRKTFILLSRRTCIIFARKTHIS